MYGVCVPPKRVVFPHTEGHVPGFGKKLVPERFDQFQMHHVVDSDAHGGKGQEYDFDVKNIVNYFQLVMDNNPNMLDSLFTPQHCVLYSSPVWNMVRENRRLFLHKGCFHRLKGYSFAQLHKMSNKNKESEKRQESIDKYGYDVKFGYHVVRLILQCEQLLVEGDLDLMRNAELLKSIRRGEWTEERVRKFFEDKEKHLEDLYHSSTALPYEPDERAIKRLLIQVLEHHYGSLKDAIVDQDADRDALMAIRKVLDGRGI